MRQRRLQAVPCTRIGAWAISVAALAATVTLGPIVSVPRAAAAHDPEPPPTALWEQFPLNPTGERLRTEPNVRDVLRPPTVPLATPAPASPGGDSTPFLLAGVAAVATLVLVLAGFSVGAGLTSGRHRRTGSERRPTAYVSAFLVGSRWLPVVDEADGAETRRSLAGARTAVGFGLALAIVAALLVIRYG